MKIIHCNRKEFLLRSKDKKIIFFGASIQPLEAVTELSKLDNKFLDRVLSIVDNDESKNNTFIEINNKKISVKDVNYFNNIDMKEVCILITSRFYYDIAKQLEEMDQYPDTEVYAYPCLILDTEETPEDLYYSRITGQALLEYSEYLNTSHFSQNEINIKSEEMCNYLNQNNGNKHRVIPSIVLLHSNICSLKCKDCCDLIPQTKKHYHLSAKSVISDFENLLRGVDKCIRADLTDGEVFLYDELDYLMEKLITNEKVETIFMYTNATVLPKESTLKLLANEKCFIHISDYGLDEKLRKFTELMDKYNIQYKILKSMTWMDFKTSRIEKRKESHKWLRYDFLRCGNKKCSKPLINGRVYGCMPAFRSFCVGQKVSDYDYIILNESDTPEEIWNKLKNLCLIDYINACDYCNFGNTALKIIKAGM